MKGIKEFKGVYLHREPIDMRRGINGLSQLVEGAVMGELMAPNLFVFCNRRRDLMKVLYFDRSGFAMWVKRLEKERFPWPKRHDEKVVTVTADQFSWLLDGYDVWKIKPFEELCFRQVS